MRVVSAVVEGELSSTMTVEGQKAGNDDVSMVFQSGLIVAVGFGECSPDLRVFLWGEM